jgi:hypothetical protein
MIARSARGRFNLLLPWRGQREAHVTGFRLMIVGYQHANRRDVDAITASPTLFLCNRAICSVTTRPVRRRDRRGWEQAWACMCDHCHFRIRFYIFYRFFTFNSLGGCIQYG